MCILTCYEMCILTFYPVPNVHTYLLFYNLSCILTCYSTIFRAYLQDGSMMRRSVCVDPLTQTHPATPSGDGPSQRRIVAAPTQGKVSPQSHPATRDNIHRSGKAPFLLTIAMANSIPHPTPPIPPAPPAAPPQAAFRWCLTPAMGTRISIMRYVTSPRRRLTASLSQSQPHPSQHERYALTI